MVMIRKCKRAGSWYSQQPRELSRDLDRWLDEARDVLKLDSCWTEACATLNAIIVPHAGYRYSGSTAGYSYACIVEALRRKREIKRVFVLGPSHYSNLKTCGLSCCDSIRTPLGDLKIDVTFIQEVLHTYPNVFDRLELHQEEEEHSMELQYPFLRNILKENPTNNNNNDDMTMIVPIMVGHLSNKASLLSYSSIMAEWMMNPTNLFIVSSDFCHWGPQFHYTPFDKSQATPLVCDFIENLDRQGIGYMERLDGDGFSKYLRETGNTICGKYPILLLLNAIEDIKRRMSSMGFQTRLLDYKQSSRIRHHPHERDQEVDEEIASCQSSVSYVAWMVSSSLSLS